MARRNNPSGRVRVIINALHAKTGGGVTYLRNILPHLAAEPGLELHLFLHADQFELFGVPPEGVRIHLLEYRNSFLRLMIWEQLALPILAREMGADVTFSLANYGPLLAPNPVIVLRNSLAVVRRERRLSKWAYWAGLAVATLASLVGCRSAIAVSDYARRVLSFGMPAVFRGKTTIIHHGVDARFTPAEPAVPRRPDELLVVSDVYVQKNLHTLIRAMATVVRTHPATRLVIAGRLVDAEYHGELLQLARECGVTESVTFLGGQTPAELLGLYRRCTAFVFPSTVETFGNPLVEAMACGAPVVCSNSAAMPEVAGDAVLYVDPLDEGAMAATILSLLDDAALRDQLAARAMARATSYSWAETGRQTAQVLLRAAAKGAS
ncbi:glycosyltransferase family 1 protein [Magnetospirillum sp. 15-1]|uniref:glycosyltransferase family 4 protein n=1 Tax=Magnetospirillum sp. 15-1 TaxID=1979370 RepID=UPI001F5B579C|nr:glycosyltransferase family 1 protein [Magnetospirillum sp. 15-1]